MPLILDPIRWGYLPATLSKMKEERFFLAVQDVVLDMNNASVRGGRTRFLKEGDVFGVVSFFTGAEQMEVRGVNICVNIVDRIVAADEQSAPLACFIPAQTVSSLEVVRVLAIHRADYESIAERFQVRWQLASIQQHCTVCASVPAAGSCCSPASHHDPFLPIALLPI